MMVVYKEYFCMVLIYGVILSSFRCLVVSALVRMWRRLRYQCMLIYVGYHPHCVHGFTTHNEDVPP
jgi:hypothetical protein